MIVATPSPLPVTRSPIRRSPLDELADHLNGAREDIARAEAMLARQGPRDRTRGEREPT